MQGFLGIAHPVSRNTCQTLPKYDRIVTMSGLILYSVNPRSLGPVPEWMAALNEAERLGCNAIYLDPFHTVTAAQKNYQGQTVSGSLYAIRDHFTVNPEFCGGADQATARAQLADFIHIARVRKFRVMTDLVFNHVAMDHPLILDHPDFFKHNPDGSLFAPGPANDPWSDIAQIDYDHPAAWDYFLGDNGYWLRLIDDYLDLGFNAFRCGAVYWLPHLVWEQTLNYALRREPDTLVLAEGLGFAGQDAELMSHTLRESDARIIYDLCYDDVGRHWDGCNVAALNRARAARRAQAAHYGTMGFVDGHNFMPRAAEWRKKLADDPDADRKIGAICLRDYAIACFTNNSVMIPRGYQWCVENNIGHFREQVSPVPFQAIKAERQQRASPLALGPAIAEMHKIRTGLPAHARVELTNAFPLDESNLTALQCDFYPMGNQQVAATIIVLLNTAPEIGTQQFPEDWWRKIKDGQSNAQRLQFGADRAKQDQISGVAILVVPGGLPVLRQLTPDARIALNQSAPELTPAWVA